MVARAVPYTLAPASTSTILNPRLSRLQPYPFDRLRQCFAGVTPNPALAPINLSIGAPRQPTPALLLDALAGGLKGLANYPTTLGAPALREASASNPGRGCIRIALVAAGDEGAEAVDRIVRLARTL